MAMRRWHQWLIISTLAVLAWIAVVIAQVILARAAQAATVTQAVTGTLTITIQNPLALVFTPAAPTIPCLDTASAAGTVVSAVSVTGGDGNAVQLSLTGDTADFALSATTAPANIVIGPSGIAVADCGKIETLTVSATQP